MLRLIGLAFAVVILEVFYNLAGGRMVFYFSPLLALQSVVFIGMLLGPMAGLGWGLAAGLLEDLCLVTQSGAFGLTPIVYLWIGWLSGRLMCGRVDTASWAVRMIATGAGWLSGIGLGALLSAIYAGPLPVLSRPYLLSGAVTLAVQMMLAPGVGAVLVKILQPRGKFDGYTF
ncbi:MAG: hypothetical protein HY747_04645 [Elusimicrobia bacterium]|nr:hypothetical protein [Elusimicrobiota bacterium]